MNPETGIHQRFADRMAQYTDEGSLIEYLLQAAPTYRRICDGDVSLTDDEVQEHLDIRMADDDDDCEKKREHNTELNPFGCPCSKRAYVCVDTDSASFTCMQCGRTARAGFVHSSHDLSCVNTCPKYIYQPKAYLAQHLKRLEGQGYPRFDPNVLPALRAELLARGIALENTLPNDVYAALKHLKLGRLYPHRWALTKRVNPTYRPLCLSHEVFERLEHVFSVCYLRYSGQRKKTGRKRKFLSYPLFIMHALQHLGIQNVQDHFKPLKNRKLSAKYALEIQSLLRGDAF